VTVYTAVCERAGDWWEITVPELPSGRVTQARRLADVEGTVKDLVALMTDADPDDIEVKVQTPGRGPGRWFAAAGGVGLLAALAVVRRILQGR
jgi:hypothetical protein